MKKISIFLAAITMSTLTLTSCGIFDFNPSSGDTETKQEDKLTDFEFVTDDKLVLTESSAGAYPKLTLIAKETYQVKTNIDDKLGNDYYFKYSADGDDEGFTITESGLVTALDVSSTTVGSFFAYLYKKGSSRFIKTHYVITNIYPENYEYATASINDQTLSFNAETNTYSLDITAGDSYQIMLNTRSNTTLKKEYVLSDNAYSEFMSVSNEGRITTSSDITEAKTGKVTIRVSSEKTNKRLATLFLEVHIKPTEKPTNVLEVINTSNNEKLEDGDSVNLYQGDSLTLQVKYNNSLKYNVITSESDLISIDGQTNTITGISLGEALISVTYLDKSINVTIKVVENKLASIYAPNEGDDFLIHNGTLHFLGKMYAVLESGREEDISNSANLTYKVSDLSSSKKSVEFTFTKDGVSKSVTYEVKFYVSNPYDGKQTAFDFIYYGENGYGERSYLPKEGNLKLLVIPVWFTDSTNFFSVSQQDELKEDITLKILEEKADNNYWSVKSFYETESRNRLSISATISDFYTKNANISAWPDMDSPSQTFALVDEAINWYFETNTEDDRANYDSNGDGDIDGVIVYYSAYYYGEKAATQRTTAYAWASSSSTRQYNTACFCSLGGIYGFNKNTNTSTVKSATDLSIINPSGFIRGSNHTIHEVGHMFGALDLYEYAKPNEDKYYPCGSFSMQDSNTGGHEPYHTNMIGWTKPDIYASKDYEVGDKVTIAIDDFQSSGNNIVLSRDWNEYNSLFDEYLILELYTPTGLNEFDASLPAYNLRDAGIRLWHVNSVLDNISNRTVSSNVYEHGNNNIKYKTIDKDSEFDAVHLIRNNKDAEFNCASRMTSSDLFKENDVFNFEDFSKQFVKGDRLDNEEKLGWSFNVEKIYQKEAGKYTAIITLTRVDSTRTQFRATSKMGEYDQPTGDVNEYGQSVFNDENLLLNYAFNASSIYSSERAITSQGIQLFGDTDGNGGSIVISIKEKAGYTVRIDTLKFAHSPSNGIRTVTVNGRAITHDSTFEGPENPNFNPGTYDYGYIYNMSSLNTSSVKIQNTFSGTINHWSAFTISLIIVEYSIIPN